MHVSLLPEPRFRFCSASRITRASLVGLHGPAGLPDQSNPAALSLHHRDCYQDAFSWRYPFHRYCMAVFRGADDAQRGVSICALNHLDFPSSEDFAANKAIPFLIEGMPLPELIESSQDIQFFCVGQFD
jgi:hypothetical protein